MRRLRALALVAALLAVPGVAAAGKAEVYALVGGKVVPVSGPLIENATLLLRDGVIEAVGANLVVPADARVIDVKGLTLTPGLIDGFGGLGLAGVAPRPPAAGAAPAPSAPGSTPSSPLQPQALALEKLRPAEALKARDSGVTTALVIPKEGVLPGQSVLINLSGEKAEGMALRQPAGLHVHMTSLSRQYPGSLMGTVAYVRQQLYAAIRYGEEWAAYQKAPRGKKRPKFDSSLAAWQQVLSGTIPLVVTASRENDLRRALALADEFKIKVVAAGAPQAYRAAAIIKQRKLPLLVSVNFDPPKAGFFGGSDEDKEKRDIEEAERNPAELHKAQVPFALVSAYAPNFIAGIKKAIEKGLPREAALAAVTLNAAQILGVADRTGSLEAGKLGNVVVWSGEPLSKDGKVKMVFVDGQLYEPEEKPDMKDPKKDGEKPEARPAEEVTR
ncbi:MAG TPA: amidohydrolase family protein [Vicinamibacteria bacterium]|nr:amidohydrolase family protein [Vicinamibacteria bacterium]